MRVARRAGAARRGSGDGGGCPSTARLLAGEIDRQIATFATGSAAFKRLLKIPRVDIGTAAAVIASIGGMRRSRAEELVGYLGLDPTSRQSGETPARGGRISGRGNPQAQSVLVEAAWTRIRSPGPLRAFGERVRARRGANNVAVAFARKLAVLSWHLLTKDQDYAFGRPSLTRAKLRRLELQAGAPRLARRHTGDRVSATQAEKELERERQARAEGAYVRAVADHEAASGSGRSPRKKSSTPAAGQGGAAG
jgi:transposase